MDELAGEADEVVGVEVAEDAMDELRAINAERGLRARVLRAS